jgi:serine/threonine protein phosphatase PrpC
MKFSAAAMCGWRTEMEDRYFCNYLHEQDIGIFGVFDGHLGAECAIFT